MIGWTVPTSLLAHMTVTSATEPGSSARAASRVSGSDPARGVHRQPLDLGLLVLGEPERGVHDGVVLDGAGQDAARGAGPRRGAPSRGP